MSLKFHRYLINQLCFRRFASSNDSSLSTTTTTDSKKELTTKKVTDLATHKRAFSLIDPKTVHQIKRVDDVTIKNEMDLIRHRLTENRK